MLSLILPYMGFKNVLSKMASQINVHFKKVLELTVEGACGRVE
jgi:hypothetical protein